MSILSIICYVGAVHGIFLIVTILTFSKNRKRENTYLAIFTGLFVLSLANFGLSSSQFYWNYPHFAWITFPMVYLYGPVLFYYITKSLSKESFKKSDLWHFIPFIISVTFYSKFLFSTTETKRQYLSGKLQFSTEFEDLLMIILFLIHMTIYAFILLKKVHEFQTTIHKNDELNKVNIKWFKYIIYSFFAYITLLISYFILTQNSIIAYNSFGCFGLKYMMAIFMFSIGYMGFKQPELFTDSTKIKYQKSGLQDDEKVELLKKLFHSVNEEKIYLQNDLTLNLLADHIGTTVHTLSQVLNEQLKLRFSEFINSYRTNDAKYLLLHETHLNITEIFYKCGFNNKATFNTSFKKFVGITPTEYRKQLSLA